MSNWILLSLVGIASGMCASLGIGGGFVLLLYFSAIAALPQREAGLLNLLFFLPTAILALIGHIRHHLVKLRAVLPCILGGILGVFPGVWLADRLGDTWLSKLFALLVLVTGLRECFGRAPTQK